MIDDSVKHEPLTRWWTHGEYEPQQIVLVQHLGNQTWLAVDPDSDGDSMDVSERDLYWNETDALRAHRGWLESVFYFVRDFEDDADMGVLALLSERIAITNSKLDKGR